MKKMPCKNIGVWILPVLFAIVLFFLAGANLKSFYCLIKDGKIDKNAIENEYKSEFYRKDQFLDLYGMSLSALGKKMLGNFEYVKDESGIVHLISSASITEESTEQFLKDILKLKESLDKQGIPLVYVQIPSREMEGYSDYPSNAFNKTDKTIKDLKKKLDDNNIDNIDIGEKCLDSPDALPKDQFFFKTDIHLTTDAEMWVGKQLLAYLNENTPCEIAPDIFDINTYRKETYSFRGNLAREGGKYFTKADEFIIYIPDYETSFLLSNPLQGVEKSGIFDDTVMNSYTRLGDIDEYVYWVTNYLQFTSPFYNITNNLKDKNNILIIMDSMCFRTVSYLSLGCHKVTILDPRYFGGTDYIDIALKGDEYDAVIVCHSSTLFGNSFFPEQEQKERLNILNSENSVTTHSLDYCNGVWTENTNILNASRTSPYIELSGWAADLQVGLPASNVYVAIGTHILKCDYGIESQSLADYFNNINLQNAGFNVKIPMDLVITDQADKCSLWVVSADGTTVYKTFDYVINLGE
ncbi:MAG: hypothetical protein K2N73_07735 [Lachnospiraceae bacterium]|nr:hypothetical protein [Lachnospiraceae bacterium]